MTIRRLLSAAPLKRRGIAVAGEEVPPIYPSTPVGGPIEAAEATDSRGSRAAYPSTPVGGPIEAAGVDKATSASTALSVVPGGGGLAMYEILAHHGEVGAVYALGGVMTTASYQQIVELLGDVDPLFVKRIEGTGASIDEINEALGQVENEELGEERAADSSPRVAEVRAILEEIFDEPEADEAWSPADLA